jgi:uncharacterized protein (DUF305 family)
VVGGVLIGTAAAYAVNNANTSLMHAMGMSTATSASSSDRMMGSADMTTALRGKTGDEFDKAFIAEMIEHHQGAIDMAQLAKNDARHDELRTMADDIVAAQSKEIDTMKSWQVDWGYQAVPTGHDMPGM